MRKITQKWARGTPPLKNNQDACIRFTKMSDLKGDMIIPYYRKNCGFIELFKEMKEKKE